MEEIKDKPKKLALGLDLGVASCGWSLLDITDSNNVQLVDLGVRLFDEASSDGKTNAAERRGKRDLRRRLRRFHFRKHNLIDLFGKYNILPGNNFEERKDNFCKIIENMNISTNPLDLKLKGLKESLETDELAIVLYSYMQHRGFFYDVDNDEEDSNKKSTDKEKEHLKVVAEKLKTMFPSELQKENQESLGKFIGISDNSQISNKYWEEEIKELFAHQDQSKVTKEFQEAYLNLFTYVRPYYEGPGNKKSPTPFGLWRKVYDKETKQVSVEKIGNNLWDITIGKCSVYPNENRELKNAPLTEIYDFINDINNIKVLVNDSTHIEPLNENQKIALYSELDKLLIKDAFTTKEAKPLITAAELKKIIRKICGNKNLEFAKDSIEGLRQKHQKLSDKNKHKKPEYLISPLTYFWSLTWFLLQEKILASTDVCIIKDKKINLSYIQIMQDLYHALAKYPNEKEKRAQALQEFLKAHHATIDEKLVNQFLDFITKFSKTGSLSIKAMRQFIENNWNTANNESAYYHDEIIKNLSNNIDISKYLSKSSFKHDILSVNAKRMYLQALNVINKILKLWCNKKGYQLATVTIEMPRDKNSKEEKAFIEDLQKSNEDFKKKVIYTYKLSSHDISNGKTFLKILLWEKQSHVDIYDGKEIFLNELLNDHMNHAFEVDHIIPYSISGIDSIDNKVLTKVDGNKDKLNKTPYQWLGAKFAEFKKRVITLFKDKLISDKKRDYLLSERTEDWAGFIGRNLSDTRYGTRVLLNTLQSFFDKNRSQYHTKVIATNGSMTHYARTNLFVENDINNAKKPIILAKDRSINNHHAIDATIIAYLGNNPKIRNILEWYRKRDNNPNYVKQLTNPLTGEVENIDNEKDISTFYGLKSEATKLLGEQLNRINNNQDDKLFVKFSRPLLSHTKNFGFFNDSTYRVIKIDGDDYQVSKKDLTKEITAKDLKTWSKYFAANESAAKLIIFKLNDPIYKKLCSIFNDPRYNKSPNDKKTKYINPFLNYIEECKENNVITSNCLIPIFKDNTRTDQHPTYIRFLRTKKKINSFFYKNNDKNGYLWVKTSLNAKCVRFYKNKKGDLKPINMNINFLTFNKEDNYPKIDENKIKQFLLKLKIDPNSEYFTLYNGSILLLNQKCIDEIISKKYLNNNIFKGKETNRVIDKVLSIWPHHHDYIRFYSIGTFNESHGLKVKLLNISEDNINDNKDEEDNNIDLYFKKNFLEEYVDLAEVDPLGNIYNRKPFKEIFSELGTPKNN